MDRVRDRETRCPRCAALFTPDEVRAAAPTARCGFCGTEVLIKLPPPMPPPPEPPPPPPMPPGFEVIEIAAPRPPAPLGDPYRTAPEPAPRPHLTIRWKQGAGFWFFLLFTVVWWAFTLVFLLAGDWGVLLHALAGVVLAWNTLVIAFNHSYVRVDSAAIAWSSEPIPFRPRRRIEVSDIEQLFAVREVKETRDGEQVRFRVKVKTRDGKERELADVHDADQARWLEHAIERHLAIEDRPVEGELV